MSDFIHELKHDHHVIQQVVAGMSAIAELLDSGKQVDPSVLADLVQFLRVFADQCHHEKEEKHLFPLLATNANSSTRRELESLEREHRSSKQSCACLASSLTTSSLLGRTAHQSGTSGEHGKKLVRRLECRDYCSTTSAGPQPATSAKLESLRA
jgi:hemerythrin-like domain-containing protein